MGGSEEKGLIGAAYAATSLTVPFGFMAGAGRAFVEDYARRTQISPRAGAVAIPTTVPHPLMRIAGTTGAMAAVGVVYGVTEELVKNSRGEDDMWNRAVAACSAGSVFGLRSGNLGVGCSACAAFAVSSMFLDLTGGPGAVTDRAGEKRKQTFDISD